MPCSYDVAGLCQERKSDRRHVPLPNLAKIPVTGNEEVEKAGSFRICVKSNHIQYWEC